MRLVIRVPKSSVPEAKQARARVHRYSGSRPGPVAGLAVAATAVMVLLTGAVSTTLPEPRPEYGDRLRELSRDMISLAGTPLTRAAQANPAELWHIQVGTFERRDAAEAHLNDLDQEMVELGPLTPTLEQVGPLTRARFSFIYNEAAARDLCGRILERGSDCVVVPPGGLSQ